MSRFHDDADEDFPNQWALWEHATWQHIRSRPGLEALREIERALLAMPTKALIEGELKDDGGGVCAVGAYAVFKERQRGGGSWEEAHERIPYAFDTWDTNQVGVKYGLRRVMACEVSLTNDEQAPISATPEERYEFVLRHVRKLIAEHPLNRRAS